MSSRGLLLAGMCIGAMLITPAMADSFSFTGSFSQDDNVRLFQFNAGASSTVTLLTFSYGGGVNANGVTIPRGGFEPILSLFSSSGMLLDQSGPNGNCPAAQTADSVTGICGDAYLNESSLSAGKYTVALTEFFNVPNGPNLSNGFLEAGHGNFTGSELCSAPGGSFLDETCNQRTGNFAFDVTGVTSASAVPEPATAWLIAPAALLIETFRRRKRR